MTKLHGLLSNFNKWQKEKIIRHILVCAVLILLIVTIQMIQLECSCSITLKQVFSRRWVYFIVNSSLVFVIDLLFLLFTRRWHWAIIIGEVFVTIMSVANYYVYLFSGDVLTLSALRSARTAMTVIGGYHFAVNSSILFIVGGALIVFILAAAAKHLLPPIPWKRIWIVLCMVVISFVALPRTLTALSRTDGVLEFNVRPNILNYGYPVHVVRNAVQMTKQVNVPAGYTDEAMDQIAEDHMNTGTSRTKEVLPDIILILNESFYDLNLYTDMDADIPYLSNYQNMDNAIRGYAAVPNVGGGTNCSEYELLTSNSSLLVNGYAPFYSMDFSDANSIVRYLKSLGYKSPWAIHAASSIDYNRTISYPAFGFENVRFDDSLTQDTYGNRYPTDASGYEDIFELYCSSGDDPRFMYFLTMQNHGGYEQNSPEFDLVHTGKDFEDTTDDVDEFLTSIKMSDDAIAQLITYFNSVDRPVIVCMVGDHAPYIISTLPPPDVSGEEREIISRSTPFFIWANDAFGPIETQNIGTISMVDLVPKVLDLAGLPLSPYYQEILDLSAEIPVRLRTGLYKTKSEEYGIFSVDDKLYSELSPYYFMEYNNLQNSSERYQVLFDPPTESK